MKNKISLPKDQRMKAHRHGATTDLVLLATATTDQQLRHLGSRESGQGHPPVQLVDNKRTDLAGLITAAAVDNKRRKKTHTGAVPAMGRENCVQALLM